MFYAYTNIFRMNVCTVWILRIQKQNNECISVVATVTNVFKVGSKREFGVKDIGLPPSHAKLICDDDRKTVFLTFAYSYIFSVFALQICSWVVPPWVDSLNRLADIFRKGCTCKISCPAML
jgi:hypothetical protein